MMIKAIEYQRQFGKTLNLGDCPSRKVPRKVNNTTVVVQERCTLHKRGVLRNIPAVSPPNVRNVLIRKPDDIVTHLDLCKGESASYLGILLDGADCVAIDIANRLRFSSNTVIRAFKGEYPTSLDILDTTNEDVRDGMESYYKEKYYMKYLRYGTLEILVVQMRFRNKRIAKLASQIKLPSSNMSDYMKEIHSRFGSPKTVAIISLSTGASSNDYKVHKLTDWDFALRTVEVEELKITKRKDSPNPPHLSYEFYPFLKDSIKGTGRLANPIKWSNITRLEIRLNRSLRLLRKLGQKCRKNKHKSCQRVREVRKSLKANKAQIHDGRSAWINFSLDEKNAFVEKYNKAVSTKFKEAKRLAREIRKMLKAMHRKRSRSNKNRRKKNRKSLSKKLRSGFLSPNHHRIRNARRRLKHRLMHHKKEKKVKSNNTYMGTRWMGMS